MFPRTGKVGGEARGEPTLAKRRSFLRELESAEALGNAGYSVIMNPIVSPEDIQKGIRRDAKPDYRIEGILFDCYSPEPPLVAHEQNRLDVFHEYDVAVGENDYDGRDWEKELVYPTNNPSLRYQHIIDDRIRAGVVDKLRGAVNEKGASRQAFGVVLNLSEVTSLVSIEQVRYLFNTRTISDFIQYVFAVAPRNGALENVTRTESVEPGQFIKLGPGILQPYKPQFDYGSYAADQVIVQLIFSRSP